MRNVLVLGAVVMLAACNGTSNKYLDGNKLSDSSNAEGRALVKFFNEDNGKMYCVPNLSESQLVEFKAKLPGMLLSNAFIHMNNQKVLQELVDSPLQNGLRVALRDKYPCK